MSAQEVLDGLGDTSPALSILRSRLQGTAGAPLRSIAAAEIGEEFGIGDEGTYVRIEGGNDRLAFALAPGLDLRLGVQAISIRQTPDEVAVVTPHEDFAASALVLAVPLGVLKQMTFEPELPDEVAHVIKMLTMGIGTQGGHRHGRPAADVPQTGHGHTRLVLDRARDVRFGASCRHRLCRVGGGGLATSGKHDFPSRPRRTGGDDRRSARGRRLELRSIVRRQLFPHRARSARDARRRWLGRWAGCFSLAST